MNKEIKISVDTKDLDRLAIGVRLYDALDLCNVNNIFKSGKLYSSGEVIAHMLSIKETDILKLIELVNGNSCINDTKIKIVK